MVALNFSPEHAPKVESGEKCQTIRMTARGKVGDPCHLYTGQRTKACRRLRKDTPPLLEVTPVKIHPLGIEVGGKKLGLREREDFAKADGFPDCRSMVLWFQQKYRKPWVSGFLHRWAPKP